MRRFQMLLIIFAFLGIAGAVLCQSQPIQPAPSVSSVFQRSYLLDIPATSDWGYATIIVPSGKSLTLQFVSVWGQAGVGTKASVSISATVASQQSTFYIPITIQNTSDGLDSLVAAQPVQIIADGDTTVYLQVFKAHATSAAKLSVSVSGQLQPTL
jgi:hypothetical protein